MTKITEVLSERRVSVDVYDISYTLLRTQDAGRAYYSVTVYLFNTQTEISESKTVRDITGDRDEATEMFRMICDGAVTPMTLEDVICDLIS